MSAVPVAVLEAGRTYGGMGLLFALGRLRLGEHEIRPPDEHCGPEDFHLLSILAMGASRSSELQGDLNPIHPGPPVEGIVTPTVSR